MVQLCSHRQFRVVCCGKDQAPDAAQGSPLSPIILVADGHSALPGLAPPPKRDGKRAQAGPFDFHEGESLDRRARPRWLAEGAVFLGAFSSAAPHILIVPRLVFA